MAPAFTFAHMNTLIGVTGTGTEVGKTALAAACLIWGQKKGFKTAYHKPVQCGLSPLPDGLGQGGDADWIQAKLGLTLAYRTSVVLAMPASPHLAAEKEGLSLHPFSLAADTLSLVRDYDFTVVEGAGGAAVPFGRDGWGILDLPLPNLAWVVACRPGLGTVHQTRTTLDWMAQRGARIAGFAFCRTDAQPSELEDDNRKVLQDLTGLPCLGILPHSLHWSGSHSLPESERQMWFEAMDAGLSAALT